MKISSSIPNPVQIPSFSTTLGSFPAGQASLETPAIAVQEQAVLESAATPVAQKATLKSNLQPVLAQMVADFGALTDSQRRNPGISTVSRVDMAQLVGHLSSESLLFLTAYDPSTYTGKDGNLFVPLETSLQAGEQKVTRRFEADTPLNESDFNNLVDKMPRRYVQTERFALQLEKIGDLRSTQLDLNDFQKMVEEMMQKTAEENAENLKEQIEKSREKTEYSSTKVSDQPVDERFPIIQKDLSDADKAMLRELEARDMAVRAHEMAHMAAGAGLTGGATYTYQVGPDGRQYAIGGEVKINISSGSTPEDTINRAQRILAAATAPTDPSSADTAVAMQASQMLSAAQIQLAQEKQAELQENTPQSPKREEELVSLSLPPEADSIDPLTGTVEGQSQLSQEHEENAERVVLSQSHPENQRLPTTLQDSQFRSLEFNDGEVLPVLPDETQRSRERFVPEEPILDEETKLPTFNTQNGQFIPTTPSVIDTDNLPDVKIQDATLFDVDVTTIAGRQTQTQTPDQTLISENIDPENSSSRFIPEARVTIPTNELIASEQQIERNLTRGQEGTPSLEDLLNAPMLLNNPLNTASPEQDEVSIATENTRAAPTITSASTQAGPIATASALPKVEPPTVNTSPQERTTQESNTESPFSVSQSETQTRFAVRQASFLSLLDE